jgi:hypothetical protein
MPHGLTKIAKRVYWRVLLTRNGVLWKYTVQGFEVTKKGFHAKGGDLLNTPTSRGG